MPTCFISTAVVQLRAIQFDAFEQPATVLYLNAAQLSYLSRLFQNQSFREPVSFGRNIFVLANAFHL